MRTVLPVHRSRLAAVSHRLGRLALPVLVVGALAHRAQIVTTPQLFGVLGLGFLLAGAAVLLGALAMALLWARGGLGWGRAVRGIGFGLVALLPVALGLVDFVRYPLVADVSTDRETPPPIVTPDGERGTRAYAPGDPEAYPGLVTRRFRVTPAELHAAARSAAEAADWTITGELPPGMPDEPTRFQAVATSLLFAFRDDIAVRILPDPVGARLDIRSASRYGRHDLGANARRIRRFFEDLDAVLVATFGAVEAVEDDEEAEDLPLLDPNAQPREEGPPPTPGTKPEETAPDAPPAADDLPPLPDDLSEIYQ